MSTTPPNAQPDSPDPDSQLDALISRIHSLTGGNPDESTPPRQQPRPAQPQPAAKPPASDMPPLAPRPAAPAAAPPTARPAPANPATAQPTGPPASAEMPHPSESTRAPNHPPATSPRPANAPATASGAAPPQLSGSVAPRAAESTAKHNQAAFTPNANIPDGPLGFQATRDEPWRPVEPEDAERGGINESLLEAIIYRFLLSSGEASGRRIADQVKVPFRLIEPILSRMKMEQHVAYKSSTSTNDYIYVLTETGRQIARNHAADCTYFGACPVPLQDYIKSVGYQTIEGQYPKKADLVRAFSDLLINPKMLNRLGPAVASGRGMFLFGFPGNGKTSIAERVTGAFGKYIWIPRAVDVDGDILRVFDPMNHELAMPEDSGGLLDIGGFDKRWVRIKRPTIVAGGELTMDMLEVMCNHETNISESPLQLKSNCGTLVIDDFGRQKMRVDELLNRWIVPLEKRYDFLNMASGKKIQVPFDQLVIFSTNLEPKDLVDDAFLRRIPYKIEVENPPEQDFRKLFEIMCRVTKMPYNPEAIDYLIKTHYLPIQRPFRNCQPRDLLLQVRNYCLYNDLELELKNEYFDFACDNYFSVM